MFLNLTNRKIACIEEIAYLHKFISKEELLIVSKKNRKSSYCNYIKNVDSYDEKC
jgi:glucose-1-phosphate thymidylyltransferase